MPLLVEPNASAKSASLLWLIPVGAAHDPRGREGLSTVLCEMLLRGAGERDSRQHADALDALGVLRSCSAGLTYVRLSATALGPNLLSALPLLVDIVRRPRLEAQAFEPARELALQTVAALRDDPAGYASLLLSERHVEQPFNRRVVGTEEGLSALTDSDIRSAWSTKATPASSILAVAGDCDADAIERALTPLLKGWEGSTPEPRIEANPDRGSYHHEADESNQVHILTAADAPKEADAESNLHRLAASVLSAGSASRLFSEVREKRGLCYSVSASYAGDKHSGRLTSYVGTTPQRSQQSLDVLLSELERIFSPAGLVTREEFDRAVVGMKSALIFSGESTSARAGALATDQHRLGKPRTLDEFARAIDAITLDDLNAYLARVHAKGKQPRTIVTLGPSPLTVTP